VAACASVSAFGGVAVVTQSQHFQNTRNLEWLLRDPCAGARAVAGWGHAARPQVWVSGQAVTEAGFAALAPAGNETRVVGTLISVGWSRSSIPDLKSSTISSVSCASRARTP